MKSILVVSHGTMAKGVYKAAKMIYGELTNAQYLCLEENMGVEDFKKNLNELIDSIKDSEQIVVLADLKGGSPYTAAVTLLSEKELLSKSKIITGLNLPMLLSTLFAEGTIKDSDVEDIINFAKEGITKFEIEKNDEDEEL